MAHANLLVGIVDPAPSVFSDPTDGNMPDDDPRLACVAAAVK
jgi:hypothetical protein